MSEEKSIEDHLLIKAKVSEAEFWKKHRDEQREALREAAPAVYGPLLEELRFVARLNGYALLVHGSQIRDLDLLAFPWVDWAVKPEVLADAIQKAIPRSFPDPRGVEKKPHGRLAWSFEFWHDAVEYRCFCVDLSVAPIVLR